MKKLRKSSRIFVLMLCLIFVLSGCGSESGDKKDGKNVAVLSKAEKDEALDAYDEYFKAHQNDYEGYEVGAMITVDKSCRPVMIMGYDYDDDNNDTSDSTFMVCNYNYKAKSVEIIKEWHHKKDDFMPVYCSDGLITEYNWGEDNVGNIVYQLDDGKVNNVMKILDGGDSYIRGELIYDGKSVELDLYEKSNQGITNDYEQEMKSLYQYLYGTDEYYKTKIDTYGSDIFMLDDDCTIMFASFGLAGYLPKEDFHYFVRLLKESEWNSQAEFWHDYIDGMHEVFGDELYPTFGWVCWDYKMKLDKAWVENYDYIEKFNDEELKSFFYGFDDVTVDARDEEIGALIRAKADEIMATESKSNNEKLSQFLKWMVEEYPAKKEEIIQKQEKIKEWQDAYQKTLNDNNISKLYKLIDMDDSGVPYMFAGDDSLYHYEDGDVRKILTAIGKEFRYCRENNIICVEDWFSGNTIDIYYDSANNFKELASFGSYLYINDNTYINKYVIDNEEVSQDKYDSSIKQYSSKMPDSGTITIFLDAVPEFTSVSAAYSDYQNNK